MSEYGTGGVLYAVHQNEQRIQGYVPQQCATISPISKLGQQNENSTARKKMNWFIFFSDLRCFL